MDSPASLDWSDLLGNEKQKDYFKQLQDFVQAERTAGKAIYPAQKDVFNALKITPAASIKVVILGQDPYHGEGQAHGLCFSVNKGIAFPPSLRNIFQELHTDLGCKIPSHGNLNSWAEQGVLLLNAVLTVEQGLPQSHQNKGWETFTDAVIESLNRLPGPIVFLLWGASAHKKANLIDQNRHRILTAPHPSPLSAHRGFFGCKHFSGANQLLMESGLTPINWCIES